MKLVIHVDGGSRGSLQSLVIGQPDFGSNAPLPGAFTLETRIKKTGLREPSGIAFDQAGRGTASSVASSRP